MLDVIFVVAVIALFALVGLLVKGVERMGPAAEPLDRRRTPLEGDGR